MKVSHATPRILATEAQAVGDIEAFLREMIASLEPEPVRSGPGRPRILPALALWAGLLVCVLRGFRSQLDLWRLLSATQLWDFPRLPISDQAVYTRLEEAGTAPLEDLFVQVSAVVAARLEPYADTSLAPFAKDVVALDHADLDPVARRLPALRAFPTGDSRLLPGQFAGLFDLRRQQWRKVRFIADVNQNEKVTAREMIASLPEESLILGDLGFFGFAWFDDLTARKQFYVSRLRQKTSYTPIHAFYQDADLFDGIVWLGAYRADRAQHAVRLVRVRHRGRWHTYLTNVLDPTLLSVHDLLALYARRWDFELAIDLVKQHLGLHLLWSAKDVVIQQQLWAVLLISQILQALRLEVAGRAGVDPFEVSLELLARWFPRLAAEGKDPIATFVTYGRQGASSAPPPASRSTPRPSPKGLCVRCPPTWSWSGFRAIPSASVASDPRNASVNNQISRLISWSQWQRRPAPTNATVRGLRGR